MFINMGCVTRDVCSRFELAHSNYGDTILVMSFLRTELVVSENINFEKIRSRKDISYWAVKDILEGMCVY